MRALKIDFSGPAPVFDFSTIIADFATTAQNALVSLGTNLGSDPVFPDRGTQLLLSAVQGAMINSVYANHAANFAALSVLSFTQNTELQSNPFKLQNFVLQSVSMQNGQGKFNAVATCVNGEQVGTVLNL